MPPMTTLLGLILIILGRHGGLLGRDSWTTSILTGMTVLPWVRQLSRPSRS